VTDPVVVPAYVDEAGAGGLVRGLAPERDHEISLICALVFDPDGHAKAVETFTPGFEAFCAAMPNGAKLHITDAFKQGNESWGGVAAKVREEFIGHLKTVLPMIVYSARRLKLAREAYVAMGNWPKRSWLPSAQQSRSPARTDRATLVSRTILCSVYRSNSMRSRTTC
jgi:hypothetical protein